MKKRRIYGLLAGILLSPCVAFAAEDYTITLKGDAFEPKELTIPAGQKVKLTVVNSNAKPMEFESHELKREKIIPAGGKAVVVVGPLEAGSYPYVDEFQEETAKGSIVAK